MIGCDDRVECWLDDARNEGEVASIFRTTMGGVEEPWAVVLWDSGFVSALPVHYLSIVLDEQDV